MPILASVVVPTYNRRAMLTMTLNSLLHQTADPATFEVVVVDDGSTDGTTEMVTKFAKEAPWRLNYVYQNNAGRARARNAGVMAAQGRYIIFLDSDMVVREGYVRAHLNAHVRPDVIVQGQIIKTADFENPTAEPAKVTDLSRASFDTGNVSVERAKLIEAGLFDLDFVEYGWEDLELGLRLTKLGLKVLRSREACGYHLKRPLTSKDIPGMIALEKERGHTAVLFYRKHPILRVKMMVSLFLGFFVLDRILTPFHWPARPGILSVLQRLHESGHRLLFAFLLAIVRNHAYADGLREGLARDATSHGKDSGRGEKK